MNKKEITPTYDLNVSLVELNQITRKLCESNFTDHGISVYWTNDKETDTAKTDFNQFGKIDCVKIRKNNFFVNPKISLSHGIILSDFDVINRVNAIFHERRHCHQLKNLTGKNIGNPVLNKRLSLAIVGTKSNSKFYKELYDCLIHERDAECFSIKQTYHYFIGYGRDNHIPKDKIEQTMVKYINDRRKQDPDYPIKRTDNEKFTDMNEILNRIEEVRDEVIILKHSSTDYCPESYYDSQKQSDPEFNDTALAAMYVRKDIFHAYRKCRYLDNALELFSAVDFELGYSSPKNWPALDKSLSDLGIPKFSADEKSKIRELYVPISSASSKQTVDRIYGEKQPDPSDRYQQAIQRLGLPKDISENPDEQDTNDFTP